MWLYTLDTWQNSENVFLARQHANLMVSDNVRIAAERYAEIKK